jgi:hypothetical protein
MAQFDAMVMGEAVRTSVTCVIYTAVCSPVRAVRRRLAGHGTRGRLNSYAVQSGLAEQLACTTYCPPGAAPDE